MWALALLLLTVATGDWREARLTATFASAEACLAYAETAIALTGGGTTVVAAARCAVDHF